METVSEETYSQDQEMNCLPENKDNKVPKDIFKGTKESTHQPIHRYLQLQCSHPTKLMMKK